MSKYQIIRSIEDDNKAVILNDTEGRFFKGYDFMGSVDWTDRIADATWMDIDEAHQIVKDLTFADEPAEPKRINHLKSESVYYIGQFKFNGQWSTVTNDQQSESKVQTWMNGLLESWKSNDKRPEGMRIVKVTTTYEVVR